MLNQLLFFMFVAALMEFMRRSHNRKTGQSLGPLAYLRFWMQNPAGAQATFDRPFNGKNGFALVGCDWLLPLMTLPLGAWWAQSGSGIAAILAAAGLGATIAVICWRVSTGQTGEGPWRVGSRRARNDTAPR